MGWLWAGFLVFVLLMLALDLGVFHLSLSRLWYAGPPLKGGTTYGQWVVFQKWR